MSSGRLASRQKIQSQFADFCSQRQIAADHKAFQKTIKDLFDKLSWEGIAYADPPNQKTLSETLEGKARSESRGGDGIPSAKEAPSKFLSSDLKQSADLSKSLRTPDAPNSASRPGPSSAHHSAAFPASVWSLPAIEIDKAGRPSLILGRTKQERVFALNLAPPTTVLSPPDFQEGAEKSSPSNALKRKSVVSAYDVLRDALGLPRADSGRTLHPSNPATQRTSVILKREEPFLLLSCRKSHPISNIPGDDVSFPPIRLTPPAFNAHAFIGDRHLILATSALNAEGTQPWGPSYLHLIDISTNEVLLTRERMDPLLSMPLVSVFSAAERDVTCGTTDCSSARFSLCRSTLRLSAPQHASSEMCDSNSLGHDPISCCLACVSASGHVALYRVVIDRKLEIRRLGILDITGCVPERWGGMDAVLEFLEEKSQFTVHLCSRSRARPQMSQCSSADRRMDRSNSPSAPQENRMELTDNRSLVYEEIRDEGRYVCIAIVISVSLYETPRNSTSSYFTYAMFPCGDSLHFQAPSWTLLSPAAVNLLYEPMVPKQTDAGEQKILKGINPSLFPLLAEATLLSVGNCQKDTSRLYQLIMLGLIEYARTASSSEYNTVVPTIDLLADLAVRLLSSFYGRASRYCKGEFGGLRLDNDTEAEMPARPFVNVSLIPEDRGLRHKLTRKILTDALSPVGATEEGDAAVGELIDAWEQLNDTDEASVVGLAERVEKVVKAYDLLRDRRTRESIMAVKSAAFLRVLRGSCETLSVV